MLMQRMGLAFALAAHGLGAQAATPDTQAAAAQAHVEAALQASHRVQLPKDAITMAVDYDYTPPTLTQFEAGKQLTIGPSQNQLLIRVAATDDLVGLREVYINFSGPSGQWTSGTSQMLPAPTQWTGVVAWKPTAVLESGIWRITSLALSDFNGNRITYDEVALARFGNNRILVSSPGTDSQKPQVLAGRIMTPQLSLSRTTPGSGGKAQYLSVDLDAQDVGVAGLREASMRFCIVGDRDCYYDIYLRGEASGESGSTPATLAVGNPLEWQQFVGTYEIREVSLTDLAGNQTFLTHRAYGGNTDFTTLFPSTTLKVKP